MPTNQPKATSKHFWKFVNAADSDAPPELTLYGNISDETWYQDVVTPKRFSQELAALGSVPEIVVRINSKGGDVFAANAIYTRLKDHPAKITVKIDSCAASAATIIAMAGDTIAIPSNGTFIIHDPLVCVCDYLNEADLTKLTGELQIIKQGMLHAYADKTGKSMDEIAKLMAAETWYNGEQAIEAGFCDTLLLKKSKTTTDAIAPGVIGQITDLAVRENIPFIQPVAIQGKKFSASSLVNHDMKKEESIMPEIKTVEELQAAYPTLVSQIMATAVEGERKRLQDIEKIAVDGFEAVVQQAKYEKPLSPGEVALAILAEQKKQGAQYLENRGQDVQADHVNSVPSAPASQSTVNEVEAAIDRVFPKTR